MTDGECTVALQKLRALLKPFSAAVQKTPGASQPSSNGDAAKEQTVSQAFAVRACGASGCLSRAREDSQLRLQLQWTCSMHTQHCRGQMKHSRTAAGLCDLSFQPDSCSNQESMRRLSPGVSQVRKPGISLSLL